MSKSTNDRNLLFGILALQMDFISREQLVAGMNAWVLAKEKPLGQILDEQNALSADHRTLLDALVAEIRAAAPAAAEAAPLVGGIALPGIERAVTSPIDGHSIGIVREGDETIARAAMDGGGSPFFAGSFSGNAASGGGPGSAGVSLGVGRFR